jgi:hypothetical protein
MTTSEKTFSDDVDIETKKLMCDQRVENKIEKYNQKHQREAE